MDTRLEMEREPAQQSSRSAGNGSGKLPVVAPKSRTAAVHPTKTPSNAGANEHQSVDPLRATDRYRLVMPYSLRL